MVDLVGHISDEKSRLGAGCADLEEKKRKKKTVWTKKEALRSRNRFSQDEIVAFGKALQKNVMDKPENI